MAIDLEMRNQIRRLFYADHLSINAISESLGVHHETVKRAIDYEKFAKRPKRQRELDPYRGVIEEKLGHYPKIPATSLIRILQDRGYRGSIETVRRFVKKLRPKYREAFSRRSVFAGEEAQVDWGHFGTLAVSGGKRPVSCFVMVLSHSRAMFARFSFDQKLATFLECHEEAFHFFGGVSRAILYDNLKSVVLERDRDAIRFNSDFLEFSGHYNFEPRPCNPYRANEKGRVERTIRYIRESFFTGITATDLGTLNQRLDEWRDETANKRPWPEDRAATVGEKFLEEKTHLLPLPQGKAETDEVLVVRSAKTPFVRFDTNDYSIPPEFIREPLTLRASQKTVALFAGSALIAEHPRSWAKGQRIEAKSHRDALLERKRSLGGQSRYAIAREVAEVNELVRLLVDRGEPLKSNLKRLETLRNQHGLAVFQQAVIEALARKTPRAESVQHIIMQFKRKDTTPALPVSLPDRREVRDLTVTSHDLNIYDNL